MGGSRTMQENIDLSVIVPCFNEQDNIPVLVERIDKAVRLYGIKTEIILVDDLSKDNTWQVMQETAKKYPTVKCVHHKVNKGIVGGWKTGTEKAQGTYILTTDADLQYLPEDIPRLYREIVKDDYDLVQGWRHATEDKNFIRWAQSKVFSGMLNVMFFMHLRDIKSGFIVYKKKVLMDVLNYKSQYKHFQHLITVAAHCKGYKIKQIPVIFEKRHAGVSYLKNVPIRFILKALTDLPKAFVEYFLKRGR